MALTRVKINLATFSYRSRGVEWLLLGIVSVCVIALSAYLIHLAVVYQGEILSYSNKIAMVQRLARQKGSAGKGTAQSTAEVDRKSLASEVEFVQGLIIRDIFPWDMVLSALERNIPKGIFLDRIETGINPHGLHITGRAGSMAEISAFLKNLDLNEIFQENRLVKFSVESVRTGTGEAKMVNFDMQCQLNMVRIMEKLRSWNKGPSASSLFKPKGRNG